MTPPNSDREWLQGFKAGIITGLTFTLALLIVAQKLKLIPFF